MVELEVKLNAEQKDKEKLSDEVRREVSPFNTD